MLKKGTLWQNIVSTTERALRTGALFSYPTRVAYIDDGGMRFVVRVLAGLKRKQEERQKQDSAAGRGEKSDPFQPPEPDLVVADISATHTALLNKFNVVDHHLLIITKNYEDQEELLTVGDFEALWTCMAEFEGLGFYNGGREGGASQPHKHLQMVRLPLAPQGPAIPIESLLASVNGNRVPGFPFLHAFERLHRPLAVSPRDAARITFELYGKMLQRVGMEPAADNILQRQSLPYCLLIARGWMLLAPRSKEFFEDISFNSLAYAGSLFVWNEEQLERIRSSGPMRALAEVSVHQ
ncbi:MAG: hypothetical protein A2X56_02375 [Nitrospirae bacterium GWC2_57_13]|nr:MAG: hypothetical protein A2072_07545 [Nitrospirae bacterium GWC1_57_7]OGW27597.1 MAG: hypothetical protein A2X56_02375 [Nitrospirae bacterium GWC2_57_13]OGW44757.1 MAG: hypothetical protein A2X57_11445 [Nitrospirae bacterium GWD2_57_8]HAR45168.1 phosphorylase [Nitrospiraceae bacterium]